MRTIPHPMSGGTLAAAGNNPLNKRILSAPADSELCFCMPQIFAAYKKARTPKSSGLVFAPKSHNL
ncbi:hypothetical protein [uncultured Parabacteroides sp.]|uniref:hypothetical protein n=1 Tax=uncultured Parabacteroides sp. TaxID=512312 RepID=UPI002605658C|nr:hypothetical protein [uncultured Parabacteroides sp.]